MYNHSSVWTLGVAIVLVCYGLFRLVFCEGMTEQYLNMQWHSCDLHGSVTSNLTGTHHI